MINVMFLVDEAGGNVFDEYISLLIEGLHKEKCTLFLAGTEDRPLFKKAEELGVKTLSLDAKNAFDIGAASKIKRFCRINDVHIIHTNSLRKNFIAALSKLLGSKVRLVRTYDTYKFNSMFTNIANSLVCLFNHRVIANCEAIMKCLATGVISENKIEVIYNGIDTGKWSGSRTGTVRKEFGISQNDIVIASSSEFTEGSGHVFLLEAFRSLKKHAAQSEAGIPGKVWFLLEGKGDMLDECRDFAKMLGIEDMVFFAGARDDIKDLFYDSDIFVSHGESHVDIKKIFQAMACRLPVIATDVHGCKKIIVEGGCGELVKKGSHENLAVKIIEFASDVSLRDKYGENAKKCAEEKFNTTNTIEKTYELYRRCGGKA